MSKNENERDLDGYATMSTPTIESGISIVSPRLMRRRSFLEDLRHGEGPLPIAFVALMLAMAFGSTVGIIPTIMTQRFAEIRYEYDGDACHSFDDYAAKPQECRDGSFDAQNAAAVTELAAATMTLLTSALIGSISDVHGRRKMFILGALMATFGPFSLLYVQGNTAANPWIYYWGRAMHGAVNFMAIALTATADILRPQQRAPGVGLVMAGFWLGLCLGPIVAILTDHYRVILISCGLQLLGLVWALLFFPETVTQQASDQARRRNELHESNQSHINRICWTISRPIRELSILNRNGFFRLLSALALFNGMVIQGDKTLLLYYVDSKLSFTPKDVAILFLLVGFTAVGSQTLLLKPLNDWIGERLIVIVCFFFSVVSNTTYGIAWDRNVLYAGVLLGGFAQMAFPTISAIKANNVVSLCFSLQRTMYTVSYPYNSFRIILNKGEFKERFTRSKQSHQELALCRCG